MPTVLVAVSHPDDESLYSGGTIRLLTQTGNEVVLLVLTRGESGRTLGMCSTDELPTVRSAELRSAADVLGIKRMLLRDLPDGNVAANLPDAVQAVAEAIHATQPQVILTFPPNGMNGHPDHMAVSEATQQARLLSNTESSALYFFASETEFEESSRPGFLEPRAVAERTLPATMIVDIGDVVVWKLRALGHHETQSRSTAKFMQIYPSRFLREPFHQVGGPQRNDPLAQMLRSPCRRK